MVKEQGRGQGQMAKARRNLNHRIYRTEKSENYRTLQDFVFFSGHLQDFFAESQIYRIFQDYRTSGSPEVCNPRFLVYYMPKAPVGQSGYQLLCIVTILHAVRGESRLVVLCCVESQCVHRESKLIGTPDQRNPLLLY